MATTALPPIDATNARRLESLPLLALACAVLILTGRWAWVAEFGDFGYTYDFASRILSGETQYADFVTTIPPLSHYTLAAFMALFGRSVLAYIAHLYVWWVLALLVAWRLLRLLGVSPGASASTLVLVTAASFPGSTLGHAQNHMANVFGGLAIGCVLRLEMLPMRRDVLLAGLFTGLTVLTKQNVGILLTAAQFVGLLVVLVPRRPFGRLVADLTMFALGWGVGLFPMLLFFAARAGAGEVAAQFLFDARKSKGGTVQILLRAIPRLRILEIPRRNLVELVANALVYVVVTFLVVSVWRRLGHRPVTDVSEPRRGRWLELRLTYVLALMAVLAVATLPDLPVVRTTLNVLSFGKSLIFFHLAGQLMYLVLWVVGLVVLLDPKGPARAHARLSAFYGLAFAFAHSTSAWYNIFYGLVVAVPLLVAAVEPVVPPRALLRALLGATVTLQATFAVTVPEFPALFARLVPFASDTPYRGLWATHERWAKVEEIRTHVAPRVRGHTTLWLAHPDVYGAWGSLHVRSAGALFVDSYPARFEPELLSYWRGKPPDFVVLGDYFPASINDPVSPLSRENVLAWLRSDYREIWSGPDSRLALWEHRR